METETMDCRVWIGCLAAYNAGTLYGEWVPVTADPEELREHVARVLKGSPVAGAEEHAFMDAEGFPRGFAGESSSCEELSAWVEELEEADARGLDRDVLEAYWDNDQWQDVPGIAARALEAFAGEHRDLGAFAWELEESTGGADARSFLAPGADPHVVEHLDRLLAAVDWDRIGRDLEHGGDVFTAPAPGGIYVFWANV